uniref:Uncharacterized protein n=2 Tax=Anguilla anguilla TaxID=7936 RepID=A0A0E9SVI8_ANGAN
MQSRIRLLMHHNTELCPIFHGLLSMNYFTDNKQMDKN